MRLSLWPSLQQPWDDIRDVVAHAESTGWHAAYLADHFMGDGGGFGPVDTPTFEATAALAALTGHTRRIRLGALVLSCSYRHPAVVASWAATLDHASRGRLLLGVGAGWQANEHEQYGIDLLTPGARLARFDEWCLVLRSLLTAPRTTRRGRWYDIVDAVCEPKPVQSPFPLLVGGKGDRMLDLVAAHADIWNHWSLPSTYPSRARVLDAACERAGRDPAAIARSTQALVLVTDDAPRARRFVERVAPRAAIAGPASALAEAFHVWAEAGVDEVIVPDWPLGAGARRRDALDAIHAAAETTGRASDTTDGG